MATKFLLTRPLRDVTTLKMNVQNTLIISTHTPLAGRDQADGHADQRLNISTHTPLAGRDLDHYPVFIHHQDFYSHAPCGT